MESKESRENRERGREEEGDLKEPKITAHTKMHDTNL